MGYWDCYTLFGGPCPCTVQLQTWQIKQLIRRKGPFLEKVKIDEHGRGVYTATDMTQ